MFNPVSTLLTARHATRAIDSRPIDEELISDLAYAVRLTPSCFNKQPWRYLFLTSEESLAKGREALAPGNRVWAERAPLLIVGYSRRDDDCVLDDGRAYHQFDLGMSAMNLMLAATHHKLVARPMAGFNPVKIKELFDLADEDEPLVMIAVGYRSEDESHLAERYREIARRPRERRPVGEIVNQL
jgi:nitroreductase